MALISSIDTLANVNITKLEDDNQSDGALEKHHIHLYIYINIYIYLSSCLIGYPNIIINGKIKKYINRAFQKGRPEYTGHI